MMALIFDTETTGLISNKTVKLEKQPEIIEFFAALTDLKTGEYNRHLNLLIKPTNKIPEDLIKKGKTKLDDEMLVNEPPFAMVAPAIRGIIESSPLVIAHNLAFDMEMVNIEFERLKQTPVSWPPGICTVEQTVHLEGKRLSLSALHERFFKVKFEGAHRAQVDVEALIRCCVELHRLGDI
jgi:DNA polymerase III epsilon subunit-like protein